MSLRWSQHSLIQCWWQLYRTPATKNNEYWQYISTSLHCNFVERSPEKTFSSQYVDSIATYYIKDYSIPYINARNCGDKRWPKPITCSLETYSLWERQTYTVKWKVDCDKSYDLNVINFCLFVTNLQKWGWYVPFHFSFKNKNLGVLLHNFNKN